jgi:hypothetical protein
MRARPAPQTLDRTARFSQEKASSFSWSHKRKRFRERLGRSGYGQSVAKAAIVELVILAKQYREIELNSPTTQSCEICLTRRSIQSWRFLYLRQRWISELLTPSAKPSNLNFFVDATNHLK